MLVQVGFGFSEKMRSNNCQDLQLLAQGVKDVKSQASKELNSGRLSPPPLSPMPVVPASSTLLTELLALEI